MPEQKTVNLFNPHLGLTGRDGGPYLDDVERRRAEEIRAQVEDREPDFDNPPAVAGTPLVVSAQLAAMVNPASNPSQQGNDPAARAIDAMAEHEDFPVTAVGEVEQTDLSQPPEYNAADPTIKAVEADSDKEPVVVDQETEDAGTTAEPNATSDFLSESGKE